MLSMLMVLFSFCSVLVLGQGAAPAVAEVTDATLGGTQTKWTTAKPSELPPGTDVIRNFLEKVEDEKWARAREALDYGPQWDFCIINAWVAFNYLTQALLEIDSSVKDCKDLVQPSGVKQRVCAADVFGVLQSFFSTGGYVAGLVSQCGHFANENAQCASAIVAWLGSITELFQGVTSIPQTCGSLDPKRKVEMPKNRRLSEDGGAENLRATAINGSKDTGRRLGSGHSTHFNPTGSKGAWCYIDVVSAVAYLAQAGVNLGAAGEDCEDQSTGELRRACSADVNGFFSSIADVVSYVGGAASICAKTVNNEGLCAGDVGTIGNALFGLGASSSVFQDVCGRRRDARLFSAGSRRLSDGAVDATHLRAPGMNAAGMGPGKAGETWV